MKKDNLYEMDVFLDKEEGKWVVDLRLSKDAVNILCDAKEGDEVLFRNYCRDCNDQQPFETYFRSYTAGGTRVPLPRITIAAENQPEVDRCGRPQFIPNPGRDRAFKEQVGAELLRKDKINRKSPTRRIIIGPRYKADVVDQVVRGFMGYYKRKASNRNVTYKLKGAIEIEEDDADG